MKKQLFLGLAAITSVAAMSQHTYKVATNAKMAKVNLNKYQNNAFEPVFPTTTQKAGPVNTLGAPYKRIGGSFNVYGVIVSEQRSLGYNEAINTVGLIHRENFELWTGIPDGNSGTISYAWSSNNGSTWDSTVIAAHPTNLNRYPTGAIYNPAANTTPSNAYIVGSGPVTSDVTNAGWIGNYFTSKQLTAPGTNANANVTYAINSSLQSGQVKQDFVRTNPQATADGAIRMLGQLYGNVNATTAAAQGWRGTTINKGLFSAGTFTWSVDSLKPDFKLNGAGAKSGYTGISNMAWSESGTVGYVIFYGVDANASAGTSQNSVQPYVYKTTDAGLTWNRFAPLFDFLTIPSISSHVRFAVQGSSTLAKPFISPNEGGSATVDAAGNLHLFATLNSAFSDHIDTLTSYVGANHNTSWNYLVDVKTTATGWDAVVLDSLQTDAADDRRTNWFASAAAGGPVTYDARLQISRTTDGKNIFYSWADTDFSIVADSSNTFPDIFQIGYDVITDKFTCKKNMTVGKIGAEKSAFFFFASPIVAKPTATSFQIPTSYTKSDDGSNNGETAISQFYLDDNMFSTSEFTVMPNTVGCVAHSGVGINEVSSSIKDLNFYPNPTSTNGTISVTLNESAKVSVSVLNAVGQVVYSTSVLANAGSNKVDINLSHLSSGLYFYQVQVANKKAVTQKFVIEK